MKRKGMKRDSLDDLFSEYIRKRAMKRVGGCERGAALGLKCGKKKSYFELECSHIWGRGDKSVRYDPDNAFGLCPGCHMYFTSHPIEHSEFVLQQLGQERFDLLRIRAKTPIRGGVDMVLIKLELTQLIKELTP
jgi:hypothetical protein